MKIFANNYKRLIAALFISLFFMTQMAVVHAQSNDTVHLQTFTYGSPQDAWFVFPGDTLQYRKILMNYKLKCNSNGVCGEWDYLTYTYLYQHTHRYDSTLYSAPSYAVNGSSPDTLHYMFAPSYSYFPSFVTTIHYTDTISYSQSTTGSGTLQSSQPFYSSKQVSRTQYLWKAAELGIAGLTAGNITDLQFNVPTAGTAMKHLKIKMKPSSLDSLKADKYETGNFTEVYNSNTTFAFAGWNKLQFVTPFYWDGTSNIVIEISYNNDTSGIDNSVMSDNTGWHSGVFSAGDDKCLFFKDIKYVSVPEAAFAPLDSFITVSLWQFGNPAFQPQDNTLFEGIDSVGNRVINVHLPWSDSNVYWDAGNVGGSYDRIFATANPQNFKGQWNYWTFTKNAATGVMKIYLNGTPFLSGTGLTRLMKGIKTFHLGSAGNGTMNYDGYIDEFAVWNAVLDSATINAWMHKDLDAGHPFNNKLRVYYQFNDNSYFTTPDSSGNGFNGAMVGPPARYTIPADSLFRNFSEIMVRPNIIFGKGVYTMHVDTTVVADSTENTPFQVVLFGDVTHPTTPTDTLIGWPSYYDHYTYDSLGIAIDSAAVIPDTTLYLINTHYYGAPWEIVNRYELARYITPYGNNLSLGNGFTWVFDVTDYASLLRDSVELSAGNNEELLDLSFDMIKGTPTRDIESIQNLWNGGFNYGDTNNPLDNYVLPKKVLIPADATTARWKSRVTGHGMDTPEDCAEFCPKYHYYKVNGTQQFSKLVWRNNCDKNPLFPQGGTWIYDRSNWCPGAEVWTYDMELTPFIIPGDSVLLDHDAQTYSHTGGWDYYQIEDQLVTYGSPHCSLDAGIENVLSPTTDQMWGRMNPICSQPVVVIRNNGSADLTSLTVSYGITGTTPTVYHWTGDLKFMETDTLRLGNFAWMQGASTFIIALSSPNGGVDQYPYDDVKVTPFTYVQVLPSKFVIQCKTNGWPQEDSYTLKDDNGNVILLRNGLLANHIYSDTVNLPVGCYEFKMTDLGEDGLSWWANTSQGTGSIKFKSATNALILKSFNSDFGGEIYMQFSVGLTNDINEYVYGNDPEMKIYPNPADDEILIDYDLPSGENGMIVISDMYGKKVREFSFLDKASESLKVDVSALVSGIYFVTLKTGDYSLTKKMVKE